MPVASSPDEQKDKKDFRIYIRLNQFEYRHFVKAKEELGLTAREVIEHLNTPCDCCKDIDVPLKGKKNKKNAKMTIKKGLLCKKH